MSNNIKPAKTSPLKRGRAKKRRGRPPGKTDPRRIITAARRAEALEYRKLGYKLEDIGRFMKCSTVMAGKYISAALDAIEIANVEDVRKLELERLDAMTIKAMEAALQGDTRSMDSALRIMERRSKILGIDAPVRQESHNTGALSLVFPISPDDANL